MVAMRSGRGSGFTRPGLRTYLEQPDEQRNLLALQVHLQAAVELLSDVLHVLGVARLPKHALGGRSLLPQQHQHLLWRERDGDRFPLVKAVINTAFSLCSNAN